MTPKSVGVFLAIAAFPITTGICWADAFFVGNYANRLDVSVSANTAPLIQQTNTLFGAPAPAQVEMDEVFSNSALTVDVKQSMRTFVDPVYAGSVGEIETLNVTAGPDLVPGTQVAVGLSFNRTHVLHVLDFGDNLTMSSMGAYMTGSLAQGDTLRWRLVAGIYGNAGAYAQDLTGTVTTPGPFVINVYDVDVDGIRNPYYGQSYPQVDTHSASGGFSVFITKGGSGTSYIGRLLYRNSSRQAGSVSSSDGDYNEDGAVDNYDYQLWQRSLGNSIVPYFGADGSGNGIVDAADYVVWRKYHSAVGSSQATIGEVPEPCALLLLIVASLNALLVSRSRSTRCR